MKRERRALTAIIAASCALLASCGGQEETASSQPGGSSISIFDPFASEEETPYMTISNKDELQASWRCIDGQRKVKISSNVVQDVAYAVKLGKFVLETSNSEVCSVSGQYVIPLSEGEATITARYGEYSDSVSVTISLPDDLSPSIVFTEEPEELYQAYLGEEAKLPSFVCKDYRGHDITEKAVVSSDLDADASFDKETGAFVSSVKGTHTITISISDHDNTVSQTLKLALYARIFAADSGGSSDLRVGDEFTDDHYIFANTSGEQARAFNLAPSKQYYAEVYVSKPSAAGQGAGLIHSLPSTDEGYVREWLQWTSDSGDNAQVNGYKSWMNESPEQCYARWIYYYEKSQTIGSETLDMRSYASAAKTKLAIARDGNTYYCFVNDRLTEKYVSPRFDGVDTLPGIYAHEWDVSGTDMTKANAINFYSGEKAITKIAELEDGLASWRYLRYGNEYKDCVSCDENGTLAFNGLSSSAGASEHVYYGLIVSPSTFIVGDSLIKFRYTAKKYGENSDGCLSAFNLTMLDCGALGSDDPNNKNAQLGEWSMVYYGTFNTTVKRGKGGVENPFNYTTMFQGNGMSDADHPFHYDIAAWDIEIETTVSGSSVTIRYSFTEVTDDNPQSFEETFVSDVSMASDEGKTMYCLNFQAHGLGVSFEVSDLSIEALGA